MKRCLPIPLCLALASAAALGVELWRMTPSKIGDARNAYAVRTISTNDAGNSVRFNVQLPPGKHEAFTVCAWLRTCRNTNYVSSLTTYAEWCGDPIDRWNPDLAEGAFGWGTEGGTNLTAAGGAATVVSFPWAPYTAQDEASFSNRYPKGVYTVNGWSTNAVTLSVGGTDYALGPGEFGRNVVPGPSDSVVLSGSGLAAVGISRTPLHRIFTELDGTSDEQSLFFTAGTIVTNELAFCAWRFKCEGTNQITSVP